MAPSGDEGTGVRIANHRKLRGLTQRGLALKANISYSTLTKVESGHAMAQSAMIAAVARALSINVTQLTGQPYVAELREDRLEEFIEPLRVALDIHELGLAENLAPRPAAEIAADVDGLCRDVRAGLIGPVAAALPALIEELHVIAGTSDDATAWHALAHAHRCVYDVASKWGYRDLAVLALDRMGWAGMRGTDPLIEPLRRYFRGLEYLRSGQYRHANRLLDSSIALARSCPPSVGRSATIGQAHLGNAITAARIDGGTDVEEHLSRAQELVDELGEVPSAYWLGFGPTNLAVHRVSGLIERGDYEDAVAAADDVHIPARWHATREAHHFMDLGRAFASIGKVQQSLAALRRARLVAAQQTRFHPTTRDTIEHLLSTRRRTPESLINYARWVGL